jgi:hypothetical protein
VISQRGLCDSTGPDRRDDGDLPRQRGDDEAPEDEATMKRRADCSAVRLLRPVFNMTMFEFLISPSFENTTQKVCSSRFHFIQVVHFI